MSHLFLSTKLAGFLCLARTCISSHFFYTKIDCSVSPVPSIRCQDKNAKITLAGVSTFSTIRCQCDRHETRVQFDCRGTHLIIIGCALCEQCGALVFVYQGTDVIYEYISKTSIHSI